MSYFHEDDCHDKEPRPPMVKFMTKTCPFCDYQGPSKILHDWPMAYCIEPLDPVTPGHLLVIPKPHVETFGFDLEVDRMVMGLVSSLVGHIDSANVIVSKGIAATQTVHHLHVHIVPRVKDDGLKLPWSK